MPEKRVRARGFNQFRKVVRDKAGTARAVANCKSCQYLNANDECTNPNVSKYDIVEEDNKMYCVYWRGYDYDNGRAKKDSDW